MKYLITESQYKTFLNEDIVSWEDEVEHSSPSEKVWDDLSVEDKIQIIEKRKEFYIKLIPKIEEFFKSNYGDDLSHIQTKMISVRYGHESYSTEAPEVDFYFNKASSTTRREVASLLESIFNIDTTRYAIPFYFNCFVREWKKLW